MCSSKGDEEVQWSRGGVRQSTLWKGLWAAETDESHVTLTLPLHPLVMKHASPAHTPSVTLSHPWSVTLSHPLTLSHPWSVIPPGLSSLVSPLVCHPSVTLRTTCCLLQTDADPADPSLDLRTGDVVDVTVTQAVSAECDDCD